MVDIWRKERGGGLQASPATSSVSTYGPRAAAAVPITTQPWPASAVLYFKNLGHSNRNSFTPCGFCDVESDRAVVASFRQGSDAYRVSGVSLSIADVFSDIQYQCSFPWGTIKKGSHQRRWLPLVHASVNAHRVCCPSRDQFDGVKRGFNRRTTRSASTQRCT